MDRALTFYRDLLGLTVVLDEIESGPYFCRLVGLKAARARIVKLSASDGSLIELLEYLSHPKPAPRSKVYSIGCSHVALTVDRLDQLAKAISAAGYELNSDPLTSPDGKVSVVYCHGPDGTLVELVEPK